MSRMIDLIRSSAVPASLMQAAARGALSVPASEMIEILVHLANHNKVFAQQARLTLAGWEEKSSLEAAADPKTPAEVLEYFVAHENLRPCLLPALLENPSVAESKLVEMAEKGSREIVDAMRQSGRVQKSPAILRVLALNPNSTEREAEEEQEKADLVDAADRALPEQTAGAEAAGSAEEDAAVAAFLAEHSKELALEGDKPFQPLGGLQELELMSARDAAEEVAQPPSEPQPAVPAEATATSSAAAAVKPAHVIPKKAKSADTEKGTALQKIAKLDVKGRIQLAMKGDKEMRSILIRDGTKLVALGVLENGKVTDGEVEKFAAQKNVLEAVLRQIPMKRRFAKNYNVIRNLVANPRTPLDVSLGLMKNILAQDLKNMASNKEVPDTIRKLALKMFKQKTDPTKKSQ
jgi:hypothetical protein